MGKMGQEALEPRIGKCHKENVAYFSKEWEGVQMAPEGLRNWTLFNLIRNTNEVVRVSICIIDGWIIHVTLLMSDLVITFTAHISPIQ